MAVAGTLALPIEAQRQPSGCALTATARLRHGEALRAAQMMVNAAAAERGKLLPRAAPDQQPPYPSWKDLATSKFVAQWKTDGGPMGKLARAIKWGDDEPLVGWRMHWVANADAYAFTLSDALDPCGFSYVADEREMILQGDLARANGMRVVPLGTE